jgi:hypothetical protein
MKVIVNNFQYTGVGKESMTFDLVHGNPLIIRPMTRYSLEGEFLVRPSILHQVNVAETTGKNNQVGTQSIYTSYGSYST